MVLSTNIKYCLPHKNVSLFKSIPINCHPYAAIKKSIHPPYKREFTKKKLIITKNF